jgi:hypothetical protein
MVRTKSGTVAITAIRMVTTITPARITSTNPNMDMECHIGIECIASPLPIGCGWDGKVRAASAPPTVVSLRTAGLQP